MKKWFGKEMKNSRKMSMDRVFGPTCVIFIGIYTDFKAFSKMRKESTALLKHLKKTYVKGQRIPCYSINPASSIGKEFLKEVVEKTGKIGLPMVLVCKDVKVLDAWVNPSILDLAKMSRLVSENI